MSCIKSIFLIFAVLAAILSIAVYTILLKKDPSPIVQLNNGKVQGVVLKSTGGREFFGYIGIPFAKPPIGSLRFKVFALLLTNVKFMPFFKCFNKFMLRAQCHRSHGMEFWIPQRKRLCVPNLTLWLLDLIWQILGGNLREPWILMLFFKFMNWIL